jgi:uncharacterized protein affecting Mg2+/Co2+ transport
VPGTQVTIAGSSFGAAQGSGQVWLGTANAVVQTWSDTQIVALVASGSASGNALVLQNGVMSNAVPFAVNTLQLTSVDPNSGAAATSVTFTGAGFGSVQGSGVAWLGSTAGQVVSWSDTQIVATVASTAVTGIARVQQNGVWSNALAFTVPSENGVTLMPSLLNLMVGDTHAIQALSAAGQPVTGLTWTSSDTTVVSLSSDDPPLLTAVAAGHVTITAGTASADVTVSSPTDFPGGLPLGTVLWSHPGDVDWITPAVPSPTGVADVFAFHDGTVEAIRGDGTTAWTAYVGDAQVLPDFQGGLVYLSSDGSLVKLDGMTGQPRTLYTSTDTEGGLESFAVHTDGTVFALQSDAYPVGPNVIGFDSATGAQKFTVPVPLWQPECCNSLRPWDLMIAGDGYAYVPYSHYQMLDVGGSTSHLGLLRVSSSGASDDIGIYDHTTSNVFLEADPYGYTGMITNADTGIALLWRLYDITDAGPRMTITNGTGASTVPAPEIAGQTTWAYDVYPVLQAQDGSFVGSGRATMVAFDATGGVRWSVPNYYPLMATADGGVIATSLDSVSFAIFDQNGNATGQMANIPTQSWQGSVYQVGSVDRIARPPIPLALSLWANSGGNPSGNNTAARPWYFALSFQNDFNFTPFYPNQLNNVTTGIGNWATLIKRTAVQEFQDAYSGTGTVVQGQNGKDARYPVTVFEGERADVVVRVVNQAGMTDNWGKPSPPGECGVSGVPNPLNGSWDFQVDYTLNLAGAQEAYKIPINNAQDEAAVVAGRPDLIQAIGRGIGVAAAHEAAHKFLGACCGMDADPGKDPAARGTFNAGGCSGTLDPSPWTGYWPNPILYLKWEPSAESALGQCLNRGYRTYNGSCRNN